ncbi:MAG TPA: type II toxin-antitoxin system RelE/ParE family toxin [Candidatus Angelobacter sp.]|jgi:hypothetical protein|nr:type II toxin-antitoxin system RelE/ParE family toxin [Candidatus Angelobacter sp.]
MATQAGKSERIFKTAWFSKAAKKAYIADDELCSAIRQVMLGQAGDLGGGVFKKRLNKNMYRSIVLAKGGQYWVYEYLFAKKDRDNIADDELAEFRKLAKAYSLLRGQQVSRLMQNNSWMEICNEEKT